MSTTINIPYVLTTTACAIIARIRISYNLMLQTGLVKYKKRINEKRKNSTGKTEALFLVVT